MRRWPVVPCLLTSVVLAPACSSFGAASDPAPPGAITPDGAPPPPDLVDGSAPVSTCRPERPGPAGACEQRVLFQPASGAVHEYPFDIVTDEDSVFWLALEGSTTNKAPDDLAYNGQGPVRIRRAKKRGSPEPTVLHDGTEVQRASALALDGDHVYWVARRADDQKVIRRVRKDCTSPCAPEARETGKEDGAVSQMLRVAPGVLWLVHDDKAVTEVRTADFDGTVKISRRRVLVDAAHAAITVGTNIFLVDGAASRVQRTTTDGSAAATFSLPPSGGAMAGVRLLGGDGAGLFLVRNDREIWRSSIAAPGEAAKWIDAAGAAEPFNPYGMTVDPSYVFIASADIGGVFAYDRASSAKLTAYEGNVWRVAVDADGAYWGDHDRGSSKAGVIHMLVK